MWKKAKELEKEDIFKGQKIICLTLKKTKMGYNKLRIGGEEWIWRETQG